MERAYISAQQARLKLGKKGKNMSDEDIQKLLTLLRSLTNKILDEVEYKK